MISGSPTTSYVPEIARNPPVSRYASRFTNPQGPDDERPTALEIVQDEEMLGMLEDKVILITGATSGIGIETARALKATGATIFITARDSEKGRKTVEDLLSGEEDKTKIQLLVVELGSLDSVRNAVKEFLRRSDRLNILINNAGIMGCPETKTVDGFERQFQTNHLSHFLLLNLLLPTLLSSSTPSFPSRCINVSSNGHHNGPATPPYAPTPGEYDPWIYYGASKTANIWMANQLSRLYAPRILGYSLMPGGIDTGLSKYVPEEMVAFLRSDETTSRWLKSPEQGAATTVWAALSKDLPKFRAGLYLSSCAVAGPLVEGIPYHEGWKSWAYDKEREERLWKDSLAMVGIKDGIVE
ncbi:short-chain dehydrogenase [Patellaria atrata CBS 101060]|uniref:Short-chain dehydrogenase n=1 Tax=Patellaria atrata CBS 101060 TaxID=1346257 RepID=A0A9P4SFK1_9PEZI|nr:short-chain dehydrogenase [Patellaria atrata CBS 101060]